MANPRRFEVIRSADGARWDEVLDEVGIYDFYHKAAFHRLAELRGEGSPVMVVFREQGWTVAFPLLVRPIDLPWASDGEMDATSVAGMAGPVATAGMPEGIRRCWLATLHDWLVKQRIVSVYTRLNYTMDQVSLLSGMGSVTQRHLEVSIDLTPSPEEQVARCRRGHRRQIAEMRHLGFACEEVGPDRLDEFVRLYYETMDEVDADSAFYFEPFYFSFLLREMPDQIHLFRCRDASGKTAMLVMYSICSGILHILYGGVDRSHSRYSPVKLVIDDLRERGNALGAKCVLLGSGRTLTRDSLFDFKMGFGGQEMVFRTWSHVADPRAYTALCDRAARAAGVVPDETYFPQYRHPILTEGAERPNSLISG